MQRLVFTNANGVLIDLTKEPYGITKWTGFANANLNIQSQQVPFHDGAVFLDALIGERSLSVTLAMNDGNDLEKRYELRRELISVLNSKLGEGVLVYTNDFISKQIKCVPKIPLFDTHNSNTKGTPKASLAWTACDPYWEDTEETTVFLKNFIRQNVSNNGDVPCQVKMDLFTSGVTNPFIKNFTQNKKIGLDGNFQNGFLINTNFGNKEVLEEKINFNNFTKFGMKFNSVIFSELFGLFVIVGNNGTILTSSDGVNWSSQTSGTSDDLNSIAFFKEQELFIVAGNNGIILTSSDGVNWAEQESNVSTNLNKVFCYENSIIVAGASGIILTSPDGINWTSQVSGTSYNLNSISYSESLNLIVVIGNNGTILTSSDGINWTSQVSGTSYNLIDITYSNKLGLFVVILERAYRLDSSDGVNWNFQNSGIPVTYELNCIFYSDIFNVFMTIYNNRLYVSSNGTNWESSSLGFNNQGIYGISYSKSLGMFVIVGIMGTIGMSFDGISFTLLSQAVNENLNYVNRIDDKNLFFICGNNTISYSSNDGKNWNLKRIYPSVGSNLSIYCMTYSKKLNLFVIGGKSSSYGIIFSSSDGVNWNQIYRSSDFTESFNSIIYSETLELFIAATNSKILTSPDGINWTNRKTDGLVILKCVIYSENLNMFVVVGQSGSIWTSSDAINWTLRSDMLITNDFNSVAYSKDLGLFIIVGSNGIIRSSLDGINWTTQTSGTTNNLNCVIYSDKMGMFVTTGNNGIILTSSDGINWIEQETGILINLNSISYSEMLNLFVLIGDNGTIFYSSLFTKNNMINYLSSDSDMNLGLEPGNNNFILSCDLGNINAKLTYRQKYLGV